MLCCLLYVTILEHNACQKMTVEECQNCMTKLLPPLTSLLLHSPMHCEVTVLRPDKETCKADPCTLYNAVCSCSLSYFPPFFCETCFKKLASKFNPWAHQPVLVQNYFKKSVQISHLSLLMLFCSGFPCENRWHGNRGRVTSHLGKQWSLCLLS